MVIVLPNLEILVHKILQTVQPLHQLDVDYNDNLHSQKLLGGQRERCDLCVQVQPTLLDMNLKYLDGLPMKWWHLCSLAWM